MKECGLTNKINIKMEREEAYRIISELIQKFDEQYESYKKTDYNETQTRLDFINPFFKALGWDMDNSLGYAEAYREVIHEDKIKIGGATKAPDYSFRIGGKRLFFVEAKKPSVMIKSDASVAYQIKRYGWSAKLPISIITDFEEFALYDCTHKPKPNDKPAADRIKYITYKDYLNEFDFLWETFSKEKVLKGGLDKFIKSDKGSKGTATVDKEFLESLNKWRLLLAKDISRNNKKLNEDELNFAVQQTLDRIIFLRIAEDRGVEEYGRLKEALKGKGARYQKLFDYFHHADKKYNSGLFDFKKDTLSENLKIDNEVIEQIISELYYPECPYEFSVLAVEILGSAYEQFLGKVIRITASHNAKIDDKPEVRKAGGVYYTPQYIVDYIVKNTVGELIKNKTPEEITKIKVVDPACGSGSFLLGAYQYLLDYHKDYYNNQPVSNGKAPLTPTGALTTNEKKNILLNNIFGVDIDANAVEVTKLSLLLKCLEGETNATIQQEITFEQERVLPTLDNNIKCGNSLIDTDYYDGQLNLGTFDKRVKPFNWQSAFPDVFKQGGFDAVIGNPPYGAYLDVSIQKYFCEKYKNQNYQLDSYLLFLEKSADIVVKEGYLGFIIPNTWLSNLMTTEIRKFIFTNFAIEKIYHFKYKVFFQATVDTEILLLRFKRSTPNYILIEIIDNCGKVQSLCVNQSDWINMDGKPVNILIGDKQINVKIKLEKFPVLDNFCKITQGAKPFQVGKGVPKQTQKIVDEKPYVSDKKKDKYFRPLLRGSLINKYIILWTNNYWIKFGDWLAEPRYSAGYEAREKLIIRQTGDSLIAAYDNQQFIVRDNLYTILSKNENTDLMFILGLINSRLMNWYYQNILNPEKGEALAQVKKGHISLLPINNDKNYYSVIKNNVLALLKFRKEIEYLLIPSERDQLEQQIKYTEDKIDRLVYELYGLTEEEIKVVEGE